MSAGRINQPALGNPSSQLAGIAEELATLTLELCAIPSETGNEKAIADLIEARCRATTGGEAVHRIGDSIVCDPFAAHPVGRADLPAIGLVGHLDTVRCAEDQPLEIRDGRVYGCGASDMKAGVATMLALLARWRQLESARPVWIFYHGEEGPDEGNGLEPVLASGLLPPLDFAFVLEPTDLALQLGCMGTLHARVTVRGRRAHSARPWQGENALYRAIPLLQRLAGLERREVRFGELVFYEVLVATQARTVNSKNVVPDALALNLNYRFAPGRSVAQAEAEVRDVVGAEGEVEILDAAPSGEVYLDHPLIEPWRQREGISLQPKQAWTDVARLTARGVPAVNFG
ncbi:MAG TPA: succinyl-diaminopimelate desuccinylase, partial [Longimicrobiaceae bacterium]|nr:succinyl-diaminopimelate desuccinylase [Longimicrobiaceae bacterium]